ncbi:YceI family protein [Methylophilus aquaticus]|uniref:YceI family protein n=1 Tax=Methylophilus aquaticus TaxID=1971610 RepID=A0ABT9JSU9_9PROT|nr:YceI family protein [Methylophilus aquaticus]MDP8567637.1 YceI family protein [Methylophilus aquaticus]
MKKTLMLLALLATSQAWAATETYNIDATHSFANFSIRHVVSKTSGTFNDVTGVITLDPANLNTASVRAAINVSSVNTGFGKRDEHIKADKYLDVAKYTQIQFESTKITASNQTQAVMQGKLTMHGVTKLVDIPVRVLGYGADPWGGQRAGFEGRITLKASDYGFGWATGASAPVGDDIEITLLIEGVKAK